MGSTTELLARLRLEHPSWTIRSTKGDKPRRLGWVAERENAEPIHAVELDDLETLLNRTDL